MKHRRTILWKNLCSGADVVRSLCGLGHDNTVAFDKQVTCGRCIKIISTKEKPRRWW